MIYLILAIASSALLAVIMRLSEKRVNNGLTMLAANYVMCTLAACTLAGNPFPAGESGFALTLGLGAATGVMYLAGFVLLKWNISRNGLVLPATFQKLGVLVPTAAAILVFGETPRWTQLAGMALAVAAIILTQERSNHKGMGSLPGLLCLLMAGGLADVMSKVFEQYGAPALSNHFLLYTFLTALVLCIVLCIVKKQGVTWPDVLYGFAIGVPNYMSARFLLWSLKHVPAVVTYPTFSVGTIIVITLVGVLCFREKLDRRKAAALALILAALALLNI